MTFAALILTVNGQVKLYGKLNGSIFDQQDALIPGVEVTVSGERFQKTVRSDDNGSFSFEIPVGIYTITTNQSWLFPVRRSNFAVRANENVVINLQPRIRIRSQALVATSKGIRDEYEFNKPAKFEEFFPFANSLLKVFVEYEKSKRIGSAIEYRNAVLTYNAMSLLASIVHIDKDTLSVKARGSVILDENGLRKRTDSVTLQISKLEAPSAKPLTVTP